MSNTRVTAAASLSEALPAADTHQRTKFLTIRPLENNVDEKVEFCLTLSLILKVSPN
jgi:hypothetical protein